MNKKSNTLRKVLSEASENVDNLTKGEKYAYSVDHLTMD